MTKSAPENLLLTWYGDDFTGAAAVMEVLTFSGLPSVLFLDVPTQEQLSRFSGVGAIGIATTARAKSPQWMDENLPDAFRRMSKTGAPIVHYKVCTTLDSSPVIGSIGRALEIGIKIFEPDYVPIMVAAPTMRRFQYFGNLYAAMGEEVYRIDRHPVMSKHPVTPIDEPDVARHISRQTDKIPIDLLDIETLTRKKTNPGVPWGNKHSEPHGLSIDCIDPDSEAAAGELIWEERKQNRFVIGSQGIEYSLIRHWRKLGMVPETPPVFSIGRADRIAVVSGSVSPVTAEQIAWSRANGFECIAFDAAVVCKTGNELLSEIDRVINIALEAISKGKDPLIFSAEGPDDLSVKKLNQTIEETHSSVSEANQTIGISLGKILSRIVTVAGITRAVISGGDTSGYATQQLELFALTALAPTIPGAALFQGHSDGPMNGLELALKGGQMGSPDYFGWIKNGGALR